MMEIPEGAEVEWLEDKLRQDYHTHLAAHPHPRDPDHPAPGDYGLEDEEEKNKWQKQFAQGAGHDLSSTGSDVDDV